MENRKRELTDRNNQYLATPPRCLKIIDCGDKTSGAVSVGDAGNFRVITASSIPAARPIKAERDVPEESVSPVPVLLCN